MIRLQFTTWAEVAIVATMILGLGVVGELITPVSPVSPPPTAPMEVIGRAQEGYQTAECVRTISPTTILGESSEGNPEFVVLEGAPVTECFPELVEFVSGSDEREDHLFGRIPSILFRSGFEPEPKDAPEKGFVRSDGKVDTVVTVIIPTTTPTVEGGTSTSTTLSTSTITVVDDPVIPSGGVSTPTGEGGGFPTMDKFDACRIEVFGETLPENMSENDAARFEACLGT